MQTLKSHTDGDSSLGYYDGPDLVDGLIESLRSAGLDPEALDIDDLAALDEFHALGRAATQSLAELAAVERDERVLDVGAGIGGPARVLAARYGALVTALDGTPRFCSAAEMLTRGAGLEDRVRIVLGDALALPFADATFDVVWTQAVGQNIADKRRFVAELARVVRPGGRVAMFELVAGPGGPLEYPVPWANGDDESWLVSAAELRDLLESARLDVAHWREGPAALEAIGAVAQSLPTRPAHQRLGLDLLMPDYEERMAGVARNIGQEKIALVQVVARWRERA
jgi:SAM-dependent methyltransferase